MRRFKTIHDVRAFVITNREHEWGTARVEARGLKRRLVRRALREGLVRLLSIDDKGAFYLYADPL